MSHFLCLVTCWPKLEFMLEIQTIQQCFQILTIHRAGSFRNPCNKTNEVELIFSKIARWASRAEEEMSHREMLRLIFSIKNSLSDVVPSSPSWGRSYYTHWHLGWIASPLHQLCDAMPRGIELKHWTHFLHFATRSFEATISSRSRWCSLRRAESSRWSLSLPTCLAHSPQRGRKCRRISAKKNNSQHVPVCWDSSKTINITHLRTLILMLILLINDLNISKNKINMNLHTATVSATIGAVRIFNMSTSCQ